MTNLPSTDNGYSRNKRGFVGSQEKIGVGYVLWLSHSRNGRAFDKRSQIFLRNGFDHFRLEKAGGHSVDGDAFTAEFACPAFVMPITPIIGLG